MLSDRLIKLIEDHWGQISATVINRIRHDPRLIHIRRLPEAELTEVGQNIFMNLGHWLTAPHHDELEKRYESLGRLRYQESVPLYEVVHALHIVKSQLIQFAHDHGLGQTSIDLYSEQELEQRVNRFFDELVYHMVHGYETAFRHAAHAAVG